MDLTRNIDDENKSKATALNKFKTSIQNDIITSTGRTLRCKQQRWM